MILSWKVACPSTFRVESKSTVAFTVRSSVNVASALTVKTSVLALLIVV